MGEDRAVSVAVTHVLTIGITTILISGLLLGAGSMLDDQSDRAGERELRSIGDRIAGELVTAAIEGHRTDASVEVRTRQPGTVVGGSYALELTDDAECYAGSGYDGCLYLRSSQTGIEVAIPISTPADVQVEPNRGLGGDVVVVYEPTGGPDGIVTIRGEDA